MLRRTYFYLQGPTGKKSEKRIIMANSLGKYLTVIGVSCSLLVVKTAAAQSHQVANQSTVKFTTKNFGFKVNGTLAAPEGDIQFTPDDLKKSFFHVTIKSASINTDNDSRDNHLREEEYFDVKNHPLIRFVSDNIRATGKKNGYEAVGTLTIKNKSKEITLPFTAEKTANGWLFAGGFTMNRRDYEVGGGSTISNEITVEIKVLAQ
jgi:polyisoprenoid-binding protein YceI